MFNVILAITWKKVNVAFVLMIIAICAILIYRSASSVWQGFTLTAMTDFARFAAT